ncbi:MAG: OmpH family outer membrane protein [Planctomycetes bacterium]|nr:OmpH family outer membrane protein [Planctomycetota bacterium]
MKRFLAVGALAALLWVGGAARTFEGPRIAVIDMSRLVSQHKKSREEQLLISQWRETAEKLLAEEAKKYSAEVATLDQFQPGSDMWAQKSKELRHKKAQLEVDRDMISDEFERKMARALSEAHARVGAGARVYLETHDLDAVLQHSPGPVKGNKSSDVIPEIVVRTVVAHRGTIDATDAVLAILDAGK